MAENLIDKCDEYIKKGKADKLYDYIKENDLVSEFVRQAFVSTFRGIRKEDENYKKYSNASLFALKISMDTLKKKYGEKLTNRLMRNDV